MPPSDRRHAVDFDPDHFAHRAAQGRPLAPTEAFRYAYNNNFWGGEETPSGPGSGLDQTTALRRDLPLLLQQFGVHTLLDLPCGDGRWMAKIELSGIAYTGADLLPEVVARAAARSPDRSFRTLDILESPLPTADVLLCRDCLVHFSFADIARALANVRKSNITYLLATTFPDEARNEDVRTGDWRPLNLERPPLSLPPPLASLWEGCTEQNGLFADKSLGLWRVADLHPTPAES